MHPRYVLKRKKRKELEGWCLSEMLGTHHQLRLSTASLNASRKLTAENPCWFSSFQKLGLCTCENPACQKSSKAGWFLWVAL